MWDLDGNEYIDFALSFGPMLLGQSPPAVISAVTTQLAEGIGFGANNKHEAPLAELLCEVVPSAEQVIFSNTGTEAVQAALRIARRATNRQRIIKFRGHYHGWLDSVHVAIPGSASDGAGTGGQDPEASRHTTVCDWNDLKALETAMAHDVAAVIMEPINVNGGCFAPSPGYLGAVRRLTKDAGSLLIFDEVITGLRVALGGAQQLLGVTPDLTILGKALGSGFPISAVCGSADVMDVVANGNVAHMGNFNGSPLAAAAAVAATRELMSGAADIYPRLERLTAMLHSAIDDIRVKSGLPLRFNSTPGAGFAFISEEPVLRHEDRLNSDSKRYEEFACRMLNEGVLLATRGLWYVSAAHTEDDIREVAQVVERVAKQMTQPVLEVST